jgi:hypothetical protein
MACARHDAAGDRAVLFSEVLCRTEDPRFDLTTWNALDSKAYDLSITLQ